MISLGEIKHDKVPEVCLDAGGLEDGASIVGCVKTDCKTSS